MYCFAYFSEVNETGLAALNSRKVKYVPVPVSTFSWTTMTDEVDLISDTVGSDAYGCIITPSVSTETIADGNNAGNILTATWYLPAVCENDAGCTYTEFGEETTPINYPLFRISAGMMIESYAIDGADGEATTSCTQTTTTGFALTGAVSITSIATVAFAALLTLY